MIRSSVQFSIAVEVLQTEKAAVWDSESAAVQWDKQCNQTCKIYKTVRQ